MPRRDFHFAGRVIRVEAADEPLAWLREFVAPSFAERDGDTPDQAIAYAIDAREHGRLAAHGPHPARLTRPCFTLDSGIVRGRVWNDPGGSELVRDEERDVFYRRQPDDPAAVEVVAASDDAAARLALARVLREYAMLYARRAGWLMLHAAAACVGGDAIVIAGPKRAGKTTLLLHLLVNEHGAYVSNDRVALSPGPVGLTVHGIPTIVTIRRDSTAWFAGLDAQLAGAGHHYGHRLTEWNTARERASPTPATRWSLSPRQLCHLLRVDSRAAARVAVVLFPRVAAASPGGLALEELSADDALDAWRRALSPPCAPDGMFTAGESAAAVPAAGLGLIASRVPSLSCRLGPEAYASGARSLLSVIREALARRT